MEKLLRKKVSVLQELFKKADVKSGPDISLILSSIKKKKPLQILKQLETNNTLHKFLPNKKRVEKKSLVDLKEFFTIDFLEKKAIDVIIHLYFAELVSKGKKDVLKWKAIASVIISLPEKDYSTDEVKWLIEQIEDLTDEKIIVTVTEVAEAHRIMPKGDTFPGPFRVSRTPYIKEPMDSISEHSPVEYEIWLKALQLGFTLAVENGILYIIKHAPGPILYTTASAPLGKEWSENRFDPMIEQSGMQNMIFSQVQKKKSKKTGDKTLLKEFPGGRIKIAGYGSSAAFRSSSFRYYFGDEIDEATADLKKGGNALEQAEGRTAANKAKRKIFLFSTPVEKDQSHVYKAYLLGDQRKYYVPCPYCGFMQELIFKKLKYERDKDGILDVKSVRYPCQSDKCDKEFYNYHKTEMYDSGKCEWRPTATAKRPNYISRHISSMYAPAGMITWADIVQKHIDADESGDPGKMKAFETLYLGWPYQERGEAPSYQKVISHRSNYKSRTVPEGVIFLTLGGDVHGNNIQLEICGHGRRYKTWSIDYIKIDGSTKTLTDDIDYSTGKKIESAWPKFKQMFLSGEFVYKNSNGQFAPSMAFIDSNYRTDTVIEFCETVPGLFPVIGQDKFANAHQKFQTRDLPGSNLMSVRLATNNLKDIVYSALRTIKEPGHETPPNYPEFPYNYPDSYFKMLNAEYKRGKKTGNKIIYEYYCPEGKPNHSLDCRVYNIGAREVLYHFVMESLAADIEKYEMQVKRKILVSEKLEFFYAHMEKTGIIPNESS